MRTWKHKTDRRKYKQTTTTTSKQQKQHKVTYPADGCEEGQQTLLFLFQGA